MALGGTYMDKVMDVLLVHFQPNCLGNRKILGIMCKPASNNSFNNSEDVMFSELAQLSR